ncbi:HD domain-containing protein [Sporomusa sp.]|uniref:HD domain-containing protein n=1 Tax=Sporomusa sp. TaxID=2078658 RepID=UPI002BBC9E49|nr:HD domain-containing protein [Sporomusa sp.]HWR44135.1 HD domain-containing protein [Sporomusa sp.]
MTKVKKEEYIKELKEHFGSDQRRINHALKVLAYAESIMDGEGADEKTRKIVIITALLHDVGIKIAEQKYNSSAGTYQEIEGPPIVTEIMARHSEPEDIIQRVAYIVGGHHTSAKNNGLDFQIIWEADLLVNIEEEGLDTHTEKLPYIIAKNFRTSTGTLIARGRYLG